MDNDIKEIRLKLYNTEKREKIEVYPSNEQFIRLYTCGPTVYDYALVEYLRSHSLDR